MVNDRDWSAAELEAWTAANWRARNTYRREQTGKPQRRTQVELGARGRSYVCRSCGRRTQLETKVCRRCAA